MALVFIADHDIFLVRLNFRVVSVPKASEIKKNAAIELGVVVQRAPGRHGLRHAWQEAWVVGC